MLCTKTDTATMRVFFGLLESEDDPEVFAALFEAAEGWLRNQGMRRVVGPLNLNINQEVGMLADGYDRPPYFLMGHARPYYHPRIEALGYQPCQCTLAYACATAYEEPQAVARLRRRLSKRLSLRPLERTRKAAELALIRDIFNDAWAANWGFVPFTEAEFKALGEALLLVTPPDLIWVAELEGEAVGFIAMIPNINEAIHDLNGRLLPLGWLKLLWRLKVRGVSSGRVPLLGVRRRLQESPLGGGVAMSLIRRCGGGGLATRHHRHRAFMDTGGQSGHAQHHRTDRRQRQQALPCLCQAACAQRLASSSPFTENTFIFNMLEQRPQPFHGCPSARPQGSGAAKPSSEGSSKRRGQGLHQASP